MDGAFLAKHCHGKSRVRLARVWRPPPGSAGVHTFVEWEVQCLLESAMEHAFLRGDNTGMTATDTVKNSVRR